MNNNLELYSFRKIINLFLLYLGSMINIFLLRGAIQIFPTVNEIQYANDLNAPSYFWRSDGLDADSQWRSIMANRSSGLLTFLGKKRTAIRTLYILLKRHLFAMDKYPLNIKGVILFQMRSSGHMFCNNNFNNRRLCQ